MNIFPFFITISTIVVQNPSRSVDLQIFYVNRIIKIFIDDGDSSLEHQDYRPETSQKVIVHDEVNSQGNPSQRYQIVVDDSSSSSDELSYSDDQANPQVPIQPNKNTFPSFGHSSQQPKAEVLSDHNTLLMKNPNRAAPSNVFPSFGLSNLRVTPPSVAPPDTQILPDSSDSDSDP
ncbi:hypothetical protein P9112_013413 [Eukaryota sp. TZLM1-RC]